MTAQELSKNIYRQLSVQNEDECLKLLEELRNFCQKATAEEIEAFRQECYGGEAFVMLATGMEYERGSK